MDVLDMYTMITGKVIIVGLEYWMSTFYTNYNKIYILYSMRLLILLFITRFLTSLWILVMLALLKGELSPCSNCLWNSAVLGATAASFALEAYKDIKCLTCSYMMLKNKVIVVLHSSSSNFILIHKVLLWGRIRRYVLHLVASDPIIWSDNRIFNVYSLWRDVLPSNVTFNSIIIRKIQMKFKSRDGDEHNKRVRGVEVCSTELIDWKTELVTPLNALS